MIFRGMSTEDLLAAQQKLTAQYLAMGPYGSQTVGPKSWTKDTSRDGLKSQLEAIQFVLNERGSPCGKYVGTMLTDFSQGTSAAQPAGTTSELSY